MTRIWSNHREWENELKNISGNNQNASLVNSIVRVFGTKYVLIPMIQLLEIFVFRQMTQFTLLFNNTYLHFFNWLLSWIINIFRILQPIFLGQLIQYFEKGNTTKTETAYMLGLGIVLCSVSIMITENSYTFESTHIGIQMRIACCSLMFRKVIFKINQQRNLFIVSLSYSAWGWVKVHWVKRRP